MTESRSILPAMLLVALVLAPAAPGTAAPPESPVRAEETGTAYPVADLETRVFTVRHRSIDEVYLVVSPILGPRGSIRTQPHKRTVAVVDTPASLLRIAVFQQTTQVQVAIRQFGFVLGNVRMVTAEFFADVEDFSLRT